MGWEYTGLPGPGDLLRATGLTDVTEEEERALEDEPELTTGTPPAIGPGGGLYSGSRLSQLVQVVRTTSPVQAAAGSLAFLGTRRQPTEDGTGSPTEVVDEFVAVVTETGAAGVETVQNATDGDSSDDGVGARLLRWLLENPGKAVLVAVFLYLVPLLASLLEIGANVTED